MGERLAGVDVASSQYQILAALLGDTDLARKLQTHSAHEIAAEAVWPRDPEGPDRAKAITVPGGYGSTPHEIAKTTGVGVHEVRRVLDALGPHVKRFRAYTHAVAASVDPYRGFEFEDPFDGTLVTWYPIAARERVIASSTAGASYKLRTYVPVGKLNAEGKAPVDRGELRRQLPPMIVHAMDSCFNGHVVLKLRDLGVENIVAVNDAWLTGESQVGTLQEAVRLAGEPWLKSLGVIYDALLKYPVAPADLKWMQGLKTRWESRVQAKAWPMFRTKPVTLASWQ